MAALYNHELYPRVTWILCGCEGNKRSQHPYLCPRFRYPQILQGVRVALDIAGTIEYDELGDLCLRIAGEI